MKRLVSLLLFTLPLLASAQKYTHQDSLRGTLNPSRSWWNVLHYTIHVNPNFMDHTIRGSVSLRFEVTGNNKAMQIHLQYPMLLDTVLFENRPLPVTRLGNAFLVEFLLLLQIGSHQEIQLMYRGKPQEAKMPPWDGGWVWKEDPDGEPWVSVACQGLGASCWFPCKDYQSDKPDSGAILSIKVPSHLMAIGNGKLIGEEPHGNEKTYAWQVISPINTYNIIPYIGHYVSFSDSIQGEGGTLNCQYWVLPHHQKKAKEQFKQVEKMLKAHEYWFGPYPFYADGYKLVDAPYLGMEHQSNIAYGNKFSNGYLGTDLSGSGWGLKWDYIIIHESGHEWFGNSMTSNDLADMWIHESFTDYSEIIYTEYWYGKDAALEYLVGLRAKIANDKPIIADYGVNKEGSTDMYYKGSRLLHTVALK
jgi:aminopeptidase N